MAIDIPGYTPGTYVLDAAHSDVGFEVRHMMMSKVRGHFEVKEATFVLPENPLDASVEATVDVASLNSRDEGRDQHLRSADFFDAETYPKITFVSTQVREEDGGLVVDGDLTIKDVTKSVTFALDIGGFGTDPWGGSKAGATATATINREDFGLTWNAALETGGVLVGREVKLTLDLQGALQS
ncbi:YceI family protein [Microbacterium amylolyticum]|uniref:Polyisoprenoid-binding protein YceI n=1 Tax=Microbacterium amylolyticum TaxID=936337 RepID=A0ABS4ZG24_9MICO|nr:YceI family protein [Microbacterium amylolyticum]MBP2436172.1 polyisoprenoid-binding protein YceI [Microbacterium amylolyticum]